MPVISVVSFVVTLNLLVLAHELGHAATARALGVQVEEFGIGYPPRLCVLARCRGTLYTLNALPLGGFVKLTGEDDPAVPGGFRAAPMPRQLAVIAAGPLMNVAVAIALSFLCYWGGWPHASAHALQVVHVHEASPAEAASLRPGDLLLEANEERLEKPEDLRRATIAAHRASPEGPPPRITLVLERDGTKQLVEVTPQPDPSSRLHLGVTVVSQPIAFTVRSSPPGKAFSLAAQDVLAVMVLVLLAPLLFLFRPMLADLVRPVGPVGVARLVGEATQASLSARWMFPLVRLAAVLSASVAVTNLLPFPALDGGRMVLIVLDRLCKRRLAPRTLERLNRVGLIVLLVLVAFVSLYDLFHPLPPVFEWVRLVNRGF